MRLNVADLALWGWCGTHCAQRQSRKVTIVLTPAIMSHTQNVLIYLYSFGRSEAGEGTDANYCKKKKGEGWGKTNPVINAVDVERLPFSSCPLLATLCPGKKVARPVGTLSGKVCSTPLYRALACKSYRYPFTHFVIISYVSCGSALL